MNNFEPRLSRDIDYYKLTMGDMINAKQPDVQTTFTLINRNKEQPLSEYVDTEDLTTRLDLIRQQGFTSEEIAYYAGLQAQDGTARFTPGYLDHIAELILPEVSITVDPESNDIAVSTTGPWTDASLWETVVMSQANELYYQNYIIKNNLDQDEILAEGNRRLTQKIERLKARPEIKISDFGTRRRFSADWQEHVIRRLATELPDNFVGTSNPWFAYTLGLNPIGTYAHELIMVYAGIQDEAGGNPMDGATAIVTDWEDHYDGDLSIALTDTYGTDMFFAGFTKQQAEKWRGLRHDSGDPFEFGDRVLDMYTQYGIDPMTKTIVFSDGLDIDMIFELYDRFAGKINVLFGWGTTLTNDLGLPKNNTVMKATHASLTTESGVDLVKLSDDVGKHTGPAALVERYAAVAASFVGSHAVKQMVRQ